MEKSEIIQNQQVKVLFEDADSNYHTGRFKDAARGFDYLVDVALSENMIEELFYFTYRGLISYKTAKKQREWIRLLKKIGITSLKLVTNIITSQLKETKDRREIVFLLETLSSTLDNLNKVEELQETKKSLLDNYIHLLKEHDSTINEKIGFASKIIQLYEELGDGVKIKHFKYKLASLFEKNALRLTEQGGFESELIIQKEWEKARDIYEEFDDDDQIKKINASITELFSIS